MAVFRLLDAAEFVLAPVMLSTSPSKIATPLPLVTPVFIPHFYAMSNGWEKYGVDPLKILVEWVRRKNMAGEKDMIMDVVLYLSRKAPAKL